MIRKGENRTCTFIIKVKKKSIVIETEYIDPF
jgi:hypothetical protein